MKAQSSRTIVIGVGVLFLVLIAVWWGSLDEGKDDLAINPPEVRTQNREKRKRTRVSSPNSGQNIVANSERQIALDGLFDSQRFPRLDHERFMTHFRDWFEADREAAAEAALLLQDESLRRLALEQGIVLFAQDVGMLVEFCSDSFTDPDEKYSFAISCVEKLSPLHFESALVMLSEEEFSEYRSDGIGAVFEMLGKSEDVPFYSIISSSSEFEGKNRDLAIRAALRYRNSITLDDCKVLLTHTKNIEILVRAFEGASAKMVAEVGLESFNEKLNEVELSRPLSQKIFEICLIQGTKAKPLEDVLDLMQQSPLWEKGVDEKFVTSLIESEFSISSAQTYALSLPDDNRNKGAAIAGVASAAVRADVVKASEWIGGLPAGELRDKALKPLLTFLKKNNDTESLGEWSKLLSGKR